MGDSSTHWLPSPMTMSKGPIYLAMGEQGIEGDNDAMAG